MGSKLSPMLVDAQVAAETQSVPDSQNAHRYATAPELIFDRKSIAPLWINEFKLWFVNRREFYVQNAYATPADYEKQAAAYVRVKAVLTEEHIIRPPLRDSHHRPLYDRPRLKYLQVVLP